MSRIYFSQRDNRWKNKVYSSVGNANQTMKSSGCGPTSAAMVVSSLTDKIIYPDNMADEFVKGGFRTPSNGTAWAAFGWVAQKYGCRFEETIDTQSAVKCAREGGMVIVSARGGNTALFSTGGHFVVIIGIAGDTFTVYDPDLYNGKYKINGRQNKAVVSGKEVYVKKDIMKGEAVKYFCYYPNEKTPITTKAKYVRVNTSLNIRSGAGTNYGIVGSLKNNTLVTVYEETNSFSKIGQNKWVASQYLKDKPSTQIVNKVMTVNAQIGLNVRQVPSVNGKVVTAYRFGTRVTIYEIQNGWARGVKGWMKANYLI